MYYHSLFFCGEAQTMELPILMLAAVVATTLNFQKKSRYMNLYDVRFFKI